MTYSHSSLLRCLTIWALGSFLWLSSVQSYPFTPGNLVVVRVGDGKEVVSDSAEPVSLVEYSVSNSESVNEIAIPSFSGGGNNQGGLTLNGLSGYSGMVNLSADGKWLTIVGMDAQIGTPSVESTSASQVNRMVAAVNGAGEILMKARLTDAASGSDMHSVVTDDSSTFYGVGSRSGLGGGARFISAASGTTISTQISSGALRHITIAKDRSGNKFLVQASHSRIQFYDGFPASAANPTPIAFASGFTGGTGAFLFLDRDEKTRASGLGGLDTLYLIGGTKIQKYEWTQEGWMWRGAAIHGPLRAIVARSVNAEVEIFAVTESASENRLVKVTDDSGFGGVWHKAPDAFTELAVSGNYRFCGLAFVPVSTDLGALSLSEGSLVPAFSGSDLSYTAAVSSESISVTPKALQTDAKIQVRLNRGAYRTVTSGSSSESLVLQPGPNSVEVLVESADGAVSSTYTVAVTRVSVPTVTMASCRNSEGTTAILGANVTRDGGAPISERGIVYGPAVANQDPVNHGTWVPATTASTGDFTVPILGLTASSSYAFRAFATNVAGTSYSPVGIFTTESYRRTNLAGMPGRFENVDGSGTAARFSSPFGVAVSSAGEIYVADAYNQVIRKITRSGDVSTVAGSPGVSGSADGIGNTARFGNPRGVAVDGRGNVYVADTNNQMIRKIAPDGLVTTLAGSPGVSGSADGTGDAARFSSPNGVAADADGNVYVADTYNQTIRKITPGGVVTTIAGRPRSAGSEDGLGSGARFFFPFGVAIDGRGTLFVADSSNRTIRRIAPNGLVTTLAGSPGKYGNADRPGREARFGNPRGVAVDGRGNVYVADTYNQRIRKITPAGEVSTLAAACLDSTAVPGRIDTKSEMQYPSGVAVDSSGNVYVADTHNKTVGKISRSSAAK